MMAIAGFRTIVSRLIGGAVLSLLKSNIDNRAGIATRPRSLKMRYGEMQANYTIQSNLNRKISRLGAVHSLIFEARMSVGKRSIMVLRVRISYEYLFLA